MAFNNYNSYEKKKNYNDKPYNKSKPTIEKIEAEVLPEDYVDVAEDLMRNFPKDKDGITTTKLRNILSMIMEIYVVEEKSTLENLNQESKAKLQLARIRIAYEGGRDNTVRKFIKESKILEYIKTIKTRKDFINFCYYLEALVAYHRFYTSKYSFDKNK